MNEELVKRLEKKRMNMFIYSVIMLVIFVAVFMGIHMYLGNFLEDNITNYPFGDELIGEAILAVLVFIVLLLWKNSYVFTEKHESIGKSLKYGRYYLFTGGFFLVVVGIFSGGLSNWHGLINLLLYCFLIGIYEEFLCRGWLLNEFLERYGDTKKGVWLSIVASGVIFGLLHTINIYTAGMDIPGVIVQVCGAAASGVLFGAIYYKTKNIWSVVLLHGFWDFSLLLASNTPAMSFSPTVQSNVFVNLIFGLLLAFIELLAVRPFIKIDEEPTKGSLIKWSIIPCILYLITFFTFAIVSTKTSDFSKEYKFDNININEYSVSSNNFSKYNINYKGFDNTYRFTLYNNNSKLELKNDTTNYSINFDTTALIDYSIIETDDSYIIGFLDLDKNYDLFLYYNIIDKDNLTNTDMFLNSIRDGFNRYGIINGEVGTIDYLYDNDNDRDYLAVNINNTYYLLKDNNKMSILNRDK